MVVSVAGRSRVVPLSPIGTAYAGSRCGLRASESEPTGRGIVMDDQVTPELATPAIPEVPVSGFRALRRTMTVCSERHVEVVDLTKQIRDAVRSVDIKEGLVLVNSLHTTCALCINEFQSAL